MKSRRSHSEFLTILFLLFVMVVMFAAPAFSSACDAGEGCFNRAEEALRGLQPYGSPLFSTGDCPTTFEQGVILLINAERAYQGLPPLLLDIRLQDAARWFAVDLANNGLQIPPDYDSRGHPKEYRVKDERGYDFDWLDETAALGSGPDNGLDTPEEIVASWMTSHSHVLLSTSAEHIGVGYADHAGPEWDDVTVADFASPEEPGESRQPPISSCDPSLYQKLFPFISK